MVPVAPLLPLVRVSGSADAYSEHTRDCIGAQAHGWQAKSEHLVTGMSATHRHRLCAAPK
jgi:hypothetical protein